MLTGVNFTLGSISKVLPLAKSSCLSIQIASDGEWRVKELTEELCFSIEQKQKETRNLKFNTEGLVETWMIMNTGERSLNLLQ